MKKRLILVPLIVMLAATALFAGQKKLVTPNDVFGFGRGAITGNGKSTCDSNTVVDSVTTNSIFSIADDSLNGAIVTITAGTGKGQVRYIWDYAHDASDCSVFVTPIWSTNPDQTSEYAIYWGLIDETQIVNAYNSISNLYYVGTHVVRAETLYSDPIPWSESRYGNGYQFVYTCYSDTNQLSSPAGSCDVKIWYETSHDGHNWVAPATAIIANMTDINLFVSDDVSLPDGTVEFRLGWTGNTGNDGNDGIIWLNQWLQMPGK